MYTKKHIIQRFNNENYIENPLKEEGLASVEQYKPRFTIAKNANYTAYYPRSEQRYTILSEQTFKPFFGATVLDVGSRTNLLSEKLNRATERVDKSNPDLPPFDWEKEVLPYADSSYDTLVCLDTLEHVENIHDALYDLLRVSKEYVVISLPNNWKKAFNEMLKGRGRWASYGLPPEKPHDRHKWFFNTEDAEDFVYYHAAPTLGNYEVAYVQYHIPRTILRIKLTYPIFRAILPEYQFKNLFVETVFFVLKKK